MFKKQHKYCKWGEQMRYLTLIVLLILFSPAAAAKPDYFFSAAVLHGELDGFTQTSDGGVIERSDPARPTFSELGISKNTQWQLELGMNWNSHLVYVAGNFNSISERATLNQPLLSQWVQFPAGDNVTSDYSLNWYQLGYAKKLSTSEELSYQIGAEVMMFDFHYQLQSSPNARVDRSYSRVAARVGGLLNYPLTDHLSIEAKAFGSLPLQTSPRINTLNLTARYQLWKSTTRGEVFAGAAFHKIEFKDNQPMPNHVLAEMMPMIELGIRISTD